MNQAAQKVRWAVRTDEAAERLARLVLEAAAGEDWPPVVMARHKDCSELVHTLNTPGDPGTDYVERGYELQTYVPAALTPSPSHTEEMPPDA